MKIRTFIRLMGIATIGGVAYVHTQRRGEWTVASLKDTLNYLKRCMGTMLSGHGESGRDSLERGANVGETGTRGTLPNDRGTRSYTDYGTRKTEPGQH
jgi:hypothetical protein